MMRLRSFVSVVVAMIALAGCGEGYRVEPGIIDVIGVTDETKGSLLTVVSAFLRQKDFEDLGKYEEMIALIKQAQMPPEAKRAELARLERERMFLKDADHLRVVWADYTHDQPPKSAPSGALPSGPFTRISIFEERPGGFSADGHRFFALFLSTLREKYGDSVIVERQPPPTDDMEYRRITLKNTIGAIVGVSIALLAPLMLTGLISLLILRECNFSPAASRVIFVLVNSWLVAPLPFPAAFIMVIPAPNLLAFPWTDLKYYRHVVSYALVSFPCTLLLCTGISVLLFRPRNSSPPTR